MTNINITMNVNDIATKVNTSRIKSKTIKCNEDGKVFGSILEAGKYYRVHPQNISHVLNGRRKHTGGLTFCYVDGDGNSINVEKSIKSDKLKRMKKITIQKESTIIAEGKRDGGNCEPCVCITEGKMFTSMTDAAEHYGTTVSQISYACKDPRKRTAAGMRFCSDKDVKLFLDVFSDAINKANAYDVLVARDATRKELIATIDQRKEAVDIIEYKLCELQKELEEAKRNLICAEHDLRNFDA